MSYKHTPDRAQLAAEEERKRMKFVNLFFAFASWGFAWGVAYFAGVEPWEATLLAILVLMGSKYWDRAMGASA